MQLKHIKTLIKNNTHKSAFKGAYANNRKVHKSMNEKYKEGIKDFKESLKESYKIPENIIEESKKLWVKKYKTLKGFSVLRALKEFN